MERVVAAHSQKGEDMELVKGVLVAGLVSRATGGFRGRVEGWWQACSSLVSYD